MVFLIEGIQLKFMEEFDKDNFFILLHFTKYVNNCNCLSIQQHSITCQAFATIKTQRTSVITDSLLLPQQKLTTFFSTSYKNNFDIFITLQISIQLIYSFRGITQRQYILPSAASPVYEQLSNYPPEAAYVTPSYLPAKDPSKQVLRTLPGINRHRQILKIRFF